MANSACPGAKTHAKKLTQKNWKEPAPEERRDKKNEKKKKKESVTQRRPLAFQEIPSMHLCAEHRSLFPPATKDMGDTCMQAR